MRLARLAAAALLAAPAVAGAAPERAATAVRAAPAGSAAHPALRAVAAEVRQAELRATITRLVAFGTRHTLSDTRSPTRGIGAARGWTAGRFAQIGAMCGGCLQVERPRGTFRGERLPADGGVIEDVLAVQRGTTDPTRVVVISAHIDSRVNDVMDDVTDAPGANDDGSGVAAVLEAARALSSRKFPATIVYAVLSGEEQGLYGGKVLANYVRAHGWRVEAALNNDIVGNTHGQNGAHVDGYVRVFSEGTRAPETPEEARRRRSTGGEVDSPSRQLSRFLQRTAEVYTPGLAAKPVWRADRYSRGGDQAPMQEAGYPAVRLTEAAENWDRQHQRVRTENGRAYGDVLSGVDFPYLARVTRLNTVALAALALAPPPPSDVKIDGALSDDTTVTWSPSPGAARYRVWWRDTTDPVWRHVQEAGAATRAVVAGAVIDDWDFGVEAVSADGYGSPVAFPGAAGTFFPAAAPAITALKPAPPR